jgi:hypothetical protein
VDTAYARETAYRFGLTTVEIEGMLVQLLPIPEKKDKKGINFSKII